MEIFEIFEILRDWIEDIPATFWGVLVGAGLSLGGVVISNRSNASRLERQLSHDRQVKKLDREYLAKKEVYMDAAEAISLALRSLTNFALLALPNQEIMKAFTEKAAVLAKVWLIGSPQTIRALAEINLSLTEAITELTEKRAPLMDEQAVLLVMDGSRKNAQLDFERMLELQKQFTIQGRRDEAEWARLSQLVERAMDRANSTSGVWVEHEKALRKKAMLVYQEALRHNVTIAALLPSLIAAVREEIELPFDPEVFKDIHAANVKKLQESSKRFSDLLDRT